MRPKNVAWFLYVFVTTTSLAKQLNRLRCCFGCELVVGHFWAAILGDIRSPDMPTGRQSIQAYTQSDSAGFLGLVC